MPLSDDDLRTSAMDTLKGLASDLDFTITANAPGTCTAGIDSQDADGNQFHDRTTIIVNP